MLTSLFALTVVVCSANVDATVCPKENLVTMSGAKFIREECVNRAEIAFAMPHVIEVECNEVDSKAKKGLEDVYFVSHLDHETYTNGIETIHVGVDEFGAYAFNPSTNIEWKDEDAKDQFLEYYNFRKVS